MSVTAAASLHWVGFQTFTGTFFYILLLKAEIAFSVSLRIPSSGYLIGRNKYEVKGSEAQRAPRWERCYQTYPQ